MASEPTLDELIAWWIERSRSTVPGTEHHRRVTATASHLRRLRDVERACEDAAPDNCARIVGADAVDAERPRYVILGEDGEPMVAEDEPAELVVTFARWVGTLTGHIEEQDRRLRALDAAVQRVRGMPQENEDVGNTHDEWFAKGYNAAMNAVARALDEGGMTVAPAVQRVRHAGGGVLLAFNDWPAYHSPLADGERRKALNALAEAIAALDAGGGA
jgi:hypothetical protein